MTTTIGFIINWWLVLGIVFGIFYLMGFYINTIFIRKTNSKYTPQDALFSGRWETAFFALSLICLMRYWEYISFNF